MRLDAYLVEHGLIKSRQRAKECIAAGHVTVNGRVLTKASMQISGDEIVECAGDLHDYVSRGALKLVAALDHFGVEPHGVIALDLGASTGGFTEVLVRRGACRVYAVDVGSGQLDTRLAGDPRVVDLSNTHANQITSQIVPDAIDLIVCDVSFISLMKVLPFAFARATAEATLVSLVKPQFELGRGALGKGGIVKWSEDEQKYWIDAHILPWLQTHGWSVRGVILSPVLGGDGNREFLLWARRDAA